MATSPSDIPDNLMLLKSSPLFRSGLFCFGDDFQ
jgi:hypothetical protein